ncbi:MAG TPA: enoyl-CoA hydratase-related protein [Chryseolinea sp.]|nr:enoyl-CoA hydratase-related protein [Chryseolinea sp.]
MINIQSKVAGRIGTITLNRSEKRNALNHEMVSELHSAFDQLEKDESVKIIVLKATGSAFCAGADLEYLQSLQNFSRQENVADSQHLKELFLKIYTLQKVVIAQVQGHAIAGGCGLAGVCDFVYAVPDAKFGYTEVRIGFVPAIVMFFLLRKIGEGHSRQLLLSGDLITAAYAAQVGLISKVVNNEDLESSVHAFASHLIESNSSQALLATKNMLANIQSLTLEDALTYAVEMNASARATADWRKGVGAFLRKEDVTW